MNYFELHLGDYAEATGHLSLLEDGAYMRLLRKYYATEKPIPADIATAQRLIAARSPDERQAVEDVLREFFDLREDGWHNRRADEAIEKYREGDADRDARRENEKERQRRTRDARRAMFDALRDRGVIPAWDIPMSELRLTYDRVMSRATGCDITSTSGVQPEVATATQSPIPNPQSPREEDQSLLSTSVDQAAHGSSRQAERLARVTADAIEAYNASRLVKLNGGLLASVNPKIGAARRQSQVRRCIKVARDICREGYGGAVIVPEFWRDYWDTCAADPFLSGRGERSVAHANWMPDFDYLTREATMVKVFEKAGAE